MKIKKLRVPSSGLHEKSRVKAKTKKRKAPASYASKRLRQEAFAKLGASGGKASAKALTPKQRSEKARKAANALWAQRRAKGRAVV